MARIKYKKWEHGDGVPAGGNGNIFIGMPRERILIPKFVDNRDSILYALESAGKGCGYFQSEGHRVDRNRDKITEEFLNHPKEPEWLLQLDTDMEHPAEVATRLARHNKPIVGGLYFHRGHTHDPFVFRESGKKKDKYGRMIPKWAPLRDEAYEFLVANGVPMRDGAVAIDDSIGEPLIRCDAVATGALLLHRSVLEIMKKPIWEYSIPGVSEDLAFCKMAKDRHNIPIYCDMSTISGHYNWVAMGQAQFRALYEGRGVNLTTYSKREAAMWLSDYLDITEEEAVAEIEKANAHMVGDYWKVRKPQTEEEVDAFYHDPYTGRLYILELLHWNFTSTFDMLRKPLMPFREGNVLEIGAGIGSVALQMFVQQNHVVACEPNEMLRGLIDHRYNWLNDQMVGKRGTLKIVDQEWTKAPDGYFDLVIALDVFEHIPQLTLKNMLKDIKRVLRVGGTLHYHANWKQQDIYPMHYDYSEEWPGWLGDLGFIQAGQFSAVRVK